MEKKNTILLTVIAVATLLVAVVGATFAYYSVDTTLQSGTTTYTAKTGPIGSIAQTLTNTNLSLKITPEDMLKLDNYENKGKSYWAINNATELSEKFYADSKQEYNIINVTLSNGDEKTHYTCKGTIEVKKGNSDTMISVAQQEDLKLYLTATNATIGTDIGSDPSGNTVTLDLSELKNEESKTKTYNVVYKVSGKDTSTSTNVSTISAALELVNRDADQKDLAGKTLAIEISTPTFNCDIDTTPTA